MAEITKPIALDETFNTTEGTSRNIADVLAQGIGDLVTVVSRISHQTTYDELSDLEDVNISSPTNGDVLTYDGSKWTNGQGGGGSSVEQMIAPVETSTTASQSYAIGEQFILNGVLYTATAAITAGGTITIGGNCTASDTVTEQIGKLYAIVTNITFSNGLGSYALNGVTSSSVALVQRCQGTGSHDMLITASCDTNQVKLAAYRTASQTAFTGTVSVNLLVYI